MGITAAVVGAGILGYSGWTSNKQEKEAKRQMNAQAAQQKDLENQLYARQQKEESDVAAITARNDAKKRQQALAAGASGQRDTILTSPLGDTSTPNSERKTLLGL